MLNWQVYNIWNRINIVWWQNISSLNLDPNVLTHMRLLLRVSCRTWIMQLQYFNVDGSFHCVMHYPFWYILSAITCSSLLTFHIKRFLKNTQIRMQTRSEKDWAHTVELNWIEISILYPKPGLLNFWEYDLASNGNCFKSESLFCPWNIRTIKSFLLQKTAPKSMCWNIQSRHCNYL